MPFKIPASPLDGKIQILVPMFLLLPVLIGPFCDLEAKEPTPPNIVLILADDLGYGDLSCYGAKDLRAAHIDSLAKNGVRFTNFYANCPVCSPTRAALLTGRYQDLVGVPGVIRTHADNNWGWLSPSAELLPISLKKAGYHTAIVGKWHLGLEESNTPNARGFDHFHGFLGDMMDDYYHHRRHGNDYMRLNRELIKPEGHATDLFTKWASDYLESRQEKKQPFLLYLAYNAPHTPIQPPQQWIAKVKDREPQITDRRAKLVALIEHMDHGIGQVLATLKKTGLDENTVVIFASDNGGQLNVGANNGPWRDGKQSMYEGGIRVPMCARWPGKIRAGSKSGRITLTMDILPTVCDIAGVKVDVPIDGVSFSRELLGKVKNEPARDVFFIRREGGNRYQGLTISAVRRGDWKLLQNSPFAPFELYNLAEDPAEQNDLAKKNRKVFNALSSALRVQTQRGGAVPWQPPARRDE